LAAVDCSDTLGGDAERWWYMGTWRVGYVLGEGVEEGEELIRLARPVVSSATTCCRALNVLHGLLARGACREGVPSAFARLARRGRGDPNGEAGLLTMSPGFRGILISNSLPWCCIPVSARMHIKSPPSFLAIPFATIRPKPSPSLDLVRDPFC
jgi:hypothetical protein